MVYEKLKIVIVGDTNTGKTTFIRNYLDYDIRYLSMTIALEYYFAEKYYSGSVFNPERVSLVKINFCDISGDKGYYHICKNYLYNTDGIIMIYDVNKIESIENLYIWKKFLLENNKEIANKILVIGNCNNKYMTNNSSIKNIDNNIINDKISNLFADKPNINIEEYKIDFYNEKNTIKKLVDDYIDEIYTKLEKNLENINLENKNDMINISLIKETKIEKTDVVLYCNKNRCCNIL
jgi:small GTP-binding protein